MHMLYTFCLHTHTHSCTCAHTQLTVDWVWLCDYLHQFRPLHNAQPVCSMKGYLDNPLECAPSYAHTQMLLQYMHSSKWDVCRIHYTLVWNCLNLLSHTIDTRRNRLATRAGSCWRVVQVTCFKYYDTATPG